MHREKMEQILLVYGLPKETAPTIMMPYKKTKVKVRSPNGDTGFFNIVAGVLQRDILGPYLFIIRLNYVFCTSITLMKKMALHGKKQEADDNLHKLLRTSTTLMT